VALPATGTLGPEDVFIPGGWHLSSAEPNVPGRKALVRTWLDPFVLRRHPVTIGEFQAFLNALVDRGDGAAAEAHLPRYMLPQRPGMFARGPDGAYALVPDPDGDELDPGWPVFLVTASAAEAYACWEAERTGEPWRLPWIVEREKAARGVDGRLFPWGDQAESTFAIGRGWRPGRALPVAVKTPTADVSVYGVQGLAGGIQDWCRDRWEGGLLRVIAGRPAPEAATPEEDRTVSGGSWNFILSTARADKRYRRGATARRESLGFRLARSWIP
jgi:serine/threonine-protein kinase